MAAEAAPTAPAPAVPPQIDHVRDGASSCHVLLDDPYTRIEHFERGGTGGTLVVTFDPLQYLWDRPPFGHEFLRRQALDVVAVRKKSEHFYQPLSRAAFDAAVAPVAARYARVFSYGSSLGAYAALYFGRSERWTVIASSPRNSTHPEFGDASWQRRVAFLHEPFDRGTAPRCEAVILYDPRDPIDRRYIETEVLPQFPHARTLRVPFAGHPANQFLADIGFIAPFVRAVLAGQAPPALDRRGTRAQSATYHQVLALACLQHGHVAWADTLIARAVALQPQRMLVQRTLGMVRLAQGDHAGATAALEAALAIDAQDPLTLSLLAAARRGATAPALPPRGSDEASALRPWAARARAWAARLLAAWRSR